MQQKLILLTLFVFVTIIIFSQTKKSLALKQYTYLALGDSYTIGEAVPIHLSFPYQTVQMLRKSGFSFHTPEIVAVTGWTTGELKNGIQETVFQAQYDFVTLLIGVNNQYRGYQHEAYSQDFENLLQRAIRFAGNNPAHVTVLSIPDYGITPFAAGGEGSREPAKISAEIDQYNAINLKIAQQYGVQYIDITPGTRQAAQDNTLLAADGLHPSGLEYTRWAQKLAAIIAPQADPY